jgi:hypothetical protein
MSPYESQIIMAGQSKVITCFTGPFGNHHILCIFIFSFTLFKGWSSSKNHHIAVVGDVFNYFNETRNRFNVENLCTKRFCNQKLQFMTFFLS